MTGQELWKEGRLTEAVEAQTAHVKAHPTEAEGRYLLFAFLCFQGELDRADRQLDALGVQDPKLEAGSMIYRNLLASEAERRRVWHEGALPLLPPEPPEWVNHRLEAVGCASKGDAASSLSALEEARRREGAARGTWNGSAFGAILDTDDFLEPILEIFAGGRYLWLPFENVRELEISEPTHLLDVLWVPAKLTDATGITADVHLPALYPDTHEGPSDGMRLGRATEWIEGPAGNRGRGQKIFFLAAADEEGEDEEKALLDIRALEIGNPPTDSPEDE